jgi:hypothetical protein
VALTGLGAMSARTRSLLTSVLLLSVLVIRSFFSPFVLFFEIFSLDTGAQPLVSHDGSIILAVNGEIYNHIELRKSLGPGVRLKTHSDCEVIIPLVVFFFHSHKRLTVCSVQSVWAGVAEQAGWHVFVCSN